MAKSLLYRLFGIGCVPDEQLRVLQAEGEQLREEGLRASVTYRNYRAGWKRCNWKRRGFVGSIMITSKRIAAFAGRATVINIGYNDPRLENIEFTADRPERLLVSFEASIFNQEHRGTVELRFSTSQAKRILEIISDLRNKQ